MSKFLYAITQPVSCSKYLGEIVVNELLLSTFLKTGYDMTKCIHSYGPDGEVSQYFSPIDFMINSKYVYLRNSDAGYSATTRAHAKLKIFDMLIGAGYKSNYYETDLISHVLSFFKNCYNDRINDSISENQDVSVIKTEKHELKEIREIIKSGKASDLIVDLLIYDYPVCEPYNIELIALTIESGYKLKHHHISKMVIDTELSGFLLQKELDVVSIKEDF